MCCVCVLCMCVVYVCCVCVRFVLMWCSLQDNLCTCMYMSSTHPFPLSSSPPTHSLSHIQLFYQSCWSILWSLYWTYLCHCPVKLRHLCHCHSCSHQAHTREIQIQTQEDPHNSPTDHRHRWPHYPLWYFMGI